jgi:hypothetical protein
MEMSRKSITEFMERYFREYSALAQDPKENYRMAEFYAPDMVFSVYLGDIEECGPEEFLGRVSSHPRIQETLIPEHMIIDEAEGMVAVLVRSTFVVKATGEMVKDMWFSAHYKLKLDEKKTLKMDHLWLVAQYPRLGEKSIFEILMEESMKFFAEKDE